MEKITLCASAWKRGAKLSKNYKLTYLAAEVAGCQGTYGLVRTSLLSGSIKFLYNIIDHRMPHGLLMIKKTYESDTG